MRMPLDCWTANPPKPAGGGSTGKKPLPMPGGGNKDKKK